MLTTRPASPVTPQECLRAAEVLRKIAAYEPGGDTGHLSRIARWLDGLANQLRVEVVRK